MKFKNILKLIPAVSLAWLLFCGCASLEQKTFVATGTAVTAVTAGMKVYRQMVWDGKVSEERQAQIRFLYERYQYAVKFEQAAVSYYREHKDKTILVRAIAELNLATENLLTELKGSNAPNTP